MTGLAKFDLDPMTVAKAFKESGMFPDLQSEAQAVVKIVAGQELGFGPMASMSAVQMIQGKPTVSANALAALVKRHPDYNYRCPPDKHTDESCEITFYERDPVSRKLEVAGVSTFTMADAQRAGIANGKAWKQYPKAMLFARAMSQGVRTHCPDVTAGAPAYVPEELGAEVDEDGAALVEDAPAIDAGALMAKEYAPPADEPPAYRIAIDAERVAEIQSALHGLKIREIDELLAAAGLDPLRARSGAAVIERIEALTPAEADALEAEARGPVADESAEATMPDA